MHKLIIGSSTTLQLPVHPTGHMLRVHIFDVRETNASSYQQMTVYGAGKSYTCTVCSDMQILLDTCNDIHNYTVTLICHPKS